MQTFDLKASERKGTGKGVARALRRQGLIPAVLYGPATASIALTISAQDLEKVYEESGGENVILNLIIEREKTLHNFEPANAEPFTPFMVRKLTVVVINRSFRIDSEIIQAATVINTFNCK